MLRQRLSSGADGASTRLTGAHRCASPHSCPSGILQQTRPRSQSEALWQATTGQQCECCFSARSKSSCVWHRMQSGSGLDGKDGVEGAGSVVGCEMEPCGATTFGLDPDGVGSVQEPRMQMRSALQSESFVHPGDSIAVALAAADPVGGSADWELHAVAAATRQAT